MQISGGVVSYEDGTKKAEEYAPPRKVRVELRFDLAADSSDDADAILAKVSAMCQQRVNALLTGEPTKPAPKATKAEPAVEPAPAKTAGQRPPKATEKPAPVQSKASLKDPEPTAMEAAVSVDEFAAEEAPAAEVSDQQLREAMTRKSAEIGGAVPIRALVGKYRPAGHTGEFSSNKIPQAQRAAFIEELKALKAA